MCSPNNLYSVHGLWIKVNCDQTYISRPRAPCSEFSDRLKCSWVIYCVAQRHEHCGHLSPPRETVPPSRTNSRKLPVPFVNRVLVPHASVASCADGHQIVQRRLAALALRNVVTRLVIKHRNSVPAPRHSALSFKPMAHRRNPHLFGQCLGDLLFPIRFAR